MQIKDTFHRWLRQQILARGRAMPSARMMELSVKGARRAARDATRRSSAYRRLLSEHGLDPADLRRELDIGRLPVLTKDNTFGRFSLQQLAEDFDPRATADVLTSSGRGGRTFGFRISDRRTHDRAWFATDLGLQDAFDVDGRTTLILNCLPMGVTFPSRAATVANVSVREDMACAILKSVGAHYDQTIVCTDPLFINQLLAEARRQAVNWAALNASFVLGEEMLVEPQRDHIARQIGLDIENDPHRWIGSSFGAAELGLNLLFETRESIRLNRAARRQEQLATILWGQPLHREDDEQPLLLCYNPLRCHVEVLSPNALGWGELCFTMLDQTSGIPLPRYATGDVGRLVNATKLQGVAATHGLDVPWLPIVALLGRRSDRQPGMPSVEFVKSLIYSDPGLSDHLCGAFRLSGPTTSHGIRLELLAAGGGTSAASPDPESLRELAQRLGPGVDVLVRTPDTDTWGPTIDYERKFRYVDVASDAHSAAPLR